MKKKFLSIFLFLVFELLIIACQKDDNNPLSPIYNIPISVTFKSVEQIGGISRTAESIGLILTFSIDPITLNTNNITVVGATKGTLTGTGTNRTLSISNITVENEGIVSIAISDPSGFTINGSLQTAIVYRVLYIGTAYQGGIVAYILQPSDLGYISGEVHGIIAASNDQSAPTNWIIGGVTQLVRNGNTVTEFGYGQANTIAMISQIGYSGGSAKIANDYESCGYSDWYLPSRDELIKIYTNRIAIGGFFTNPDKPAYWSSSEGSADIGDSYSNTAWVHNFRNGAFGRSYKGDTWRVRAIRSF